LSSKETAVDRETGSVSMILRTMPRDQNKTGLKLRKADGETGGTWSSRREQRWHHLDKDFRRMSAANSLTFQPLLMTLLREISIALQVVPPV